MNTIRSTEFASLDFESAGSAPGLSDHPIQIGIATFSNGIIQPSLRSFISCSQPITRSASKIHGIQKSHLAGAPSLHSLWPQIRNLLRGRWIVAHGSATEKRFLRVFPLHGFGPWIDTLQLTRTCDPHLPSHQLSQIAQAYQIETQLHSLIPDFRWHEALSDALAALAILQHLINRFSLQDHPPDVLITPPHAWPLSPAPSSPP